MHTYRKDILMLRKKYFIFHIILGIIIVLTIPLSMFFITLPRFVTPLILTIYALSFIFCMIKYAEKTFDRVRLIIMAVVISSLSLFGTYCNPYYNSLNFRTDPDYYSHSPYAVLSKKEAISDLDYAMYYLKKLHPAFYSEVPEKVQSRYDEIWEKISAAETISVCELSQDIEYIFAALRDGHSYVQMNVSVPHYMKHIYSYEQRNGKIKAINGITIEELVKQTSELYSYEAESWQISRIKSSISTLEGLTYLGFFAEKGVTYTYELPDGTTEDITCYTDDFLTYEEYYEYNSLSDTETADTPFVYYTVDEENSAAILTLDSCSYNDEYISCLKDMFTEVKEKGIKNVAVDLRSNGGGSSLVADEFIRYLDVDKYNTGTLKWRWGCFMIPFTYNEMKNDKYTDLTFTGDVYILTSANSFSSAMLFPQYIKDNGLGSIIGEAPGNDPNGYGEIAMLKLPYSQLYMQISTKRFFRIDQSTDEFLIEPNIPCDSEMAVDVFYETIK